MHPYSRHITTFCNHLIVLFRYKRLSFGINAEKFYNVIASGISDIPNVKSIRDDVIIYGVNVQENDKAKNYTSQKQMPVLHALNLFLWNGLQCTRNVP